MLPRITDTKQRVWDITIDVPNLERVRDRGQANLLDLLDDKSPLQKQLADPIWMGNVLYLLCEEQCDEKQVSAFDFLRGLDRDLIDEAWPHVMQGIINFSPAAVRPAYQKVLDKSQKLERLSRTQMQQAIDSPQFDQMLETKIQEFLTGSQPPAPSPQTLTTGSPAATDSSSAAASSPVSSESATSAATPSEP